LAGGFSYGDYLRTGAIARFSPVMGAIKKFADSGGIVLGICNGFQILLEASMLPGAMLPNAGLKFICSRVFLRVENSSLPFTNLASEGQVLSIPINHYEGNYFADDKTLEEMNKGGQIVLRYASKDGILSPEFCPNGSRENIAGIVNRDGNVMGLMPHPERASEAVLGSTDGALIFNSIAKYLKASSNQKSFMGGNIAG
jgi:phosphoribosylformylglycinamidine synthase